MKQIYSFTTKLLLVAAVCATVLTSCSIRKKEEKGKMVKKEVKVAPFKDLLVDGNATVNIIPGDSFAVRIEGREKIISLAKIEVEDGVLHISRGNKQSSDVHEITFGILNGTDYYPRVYITMPSLRRITLEGNADITIDKPMRGDSVRVLVASNADIDVAGLQAKFFDVRIEGNASSSLQNLNVEKTNIVIDGNADLNAVFKDAGEAEATINGNASINLSGTIRVEPHININGNASVNNNTTRGK